MRIIVTAGPTREAIDPVRFISNKSSGRMGYAIAAAAARLGHEVRLISGPVSIPAPGKVAVERVQSADEMFRAVKKSLAWCDVLVMAAAVADWKPASVCAHKMKKRSTGSLLRLVRTPDILKWAGRNRKKQLLVGFAAETRGLLAEAGRKLREKNLDLIVANDVAEPGAGFDVPTNRVTLIHRSGQVECWPLMLKTKVAGRLIKQIESMLSTGV